ncbi:MAG: FAD-binding protein [Nitrospirota bacterium]|nr:MAG: FAD-binding protein [Nitrospirota bacterium]
MKGLKDILPPDGFSDAPETLVCYGFDASGTGSKPSAVVWPEGTDDVARISKFASDNRIAIVPRGAGTGMTGGAVPLNGAIIISFERMNRILEVDEKNLTALVEPGVINGQLQREIEPMGLFYPPDPASMHFCTIGGNVAENAGGPRAVKYGVTRDYVLGIEAVLPDGRVINTGVRTMKGVVGYDLTGLIVGSEGTLCTMTRIRLKLAPLPQAVTTILAVFDDLRKCGSAVSDITSSLIVPRVLELMDRETIKAVESYKPTGLPADAEALLLIELDGQERAIAEDAEKVSNLCKALGAAVNVAVSEEQRQRLWEARRSLSPALFHISPGKVSEDIVVPRSRIPDLLVRLRSLSKKRGIDIVSFGHAGDGNIHVNIMADRNDPDQKEIIKKVVKEVFEICLEMGGTISGEHGVGTTKAGHMGLEVKGPALDMMKGIKEVFDPMNIMNPGKIFVNRDRH